MISNRLQYQMSIMETLPQKNKDDDMLARIREGSANAFDDMVITYSPKLIRVAYGLLGIKGVIRGDSVLTGGKAVNVGVLQLLFRGGGHSQGSHSQCQAKDQKKG